eukprot:jgi/Chrpa1/15494/Chrysochromulina_OHIO_Genome00006001-RA
MGGEREAAEQQDERERAFELVAERVCHLDRCATAHRKHWAHEAEGAARARSTKDRAYDATAAAAACWGGDHECARCDPEEHAQRTQAREQIQVCKVEALGSCA